MTPSQIRDKISSLKDQIRELERVVDNHKQHRVGYNDVLFELVEAWESLDRAGESLDAMAIGMA